MPLVHITLECATPTSQVDGAFRTLVAVTYAELREGAHLREAARRASIIGFGGPHRVLASRRLDAATLEPPEIRAIMEREPAAPPMSERLAARMSAGAAPDDEIADLHACHPPARAERRQAATRARIRS